MDGASTDGTVDIVEACKSGDIRLVSEPDAGMYDALNKGLGLYSGQAFGALNSDDAFHDSGVLARVAEAWPDIVHGHLDFVDSHHTKSVRRRWRAVARPPRGFRTGWMPAHPTFYVRREVVDVGSFDLTLPTAADYDWMLRAVELYGHRLRIDAVLIDMKVGGKSTSGVRSYVAHNLEALRSRRTWLGTGIALCAGRQADAQDQPVDRPVP